jgi:hypothetical protein
MYINSILSWFHELCGLWLNSGKSRDKNLAILADYEAEGTLRPLTAKFNIRLGAENLELCC